MLKSESSVPSNKKTLFIFLKTYFTKKVKVSDETLMAIVNASEIVTLKKNTIIQKGGENAKYMYALLDGIVREHATGSVGDEINILFRSAPDTMGTMYAIKNDKKAQYSISSVTRVTLSRIDGLEFLALVKKYPDLQNYVISEQEYHYMSLYARIVHMLEKDFESKLQGSTALTPEVMRRVPSYQLASYFGVTPESLSRIKSRVGLPAKKQVNVS